MLAEGVDLEPDRVAAVARIGENCEPALTSILFMAGAGGSLRAGVTENPILLTRRVQAGEVRVTMGGAPCTLWPGGGITIMADVLAIPDNAFGHVPTPALVAPIEFTLRAELYAALGGHVDQAIALETLLSRYGDAALNAPWPRANPWPDAPS
jgi:hypothetical protein